MKYTISINTEELYTFEKVYEVILHSTSNSLTVVAKDSAKNHKVLKDLDKNNEVDIDRCIFEGKEICEICIRDICIDLCLIKKATK